MVMCAVFGCNNNNNKTGKKPINKENSIGYHSFPRHSDLCKQWVVKCSRSDEFNTKTAAICSVHFNDDDYELSSLLKQKLMNFPGLKRKLKEGAIPSQNLPSAGRISEVGERRIKRNAQRESKKLISTLLRSDENLNETESVTVIQEPVLPGCSKEIEKILEIQESEPLLIENPDLLNKYKGLLQTNEDLVKKNYILFAQTEIYKNQIAQLEKQAQRNEHLKTALDKTLSTIFTPGQLKRINHPERKTVEWSVEDISHALALHEAGPRAYRWLQKNNYPLPGESTLRRWTNKIDNSRPKHHPSEEKEKNGEFADFSGSDSEKSSVSESTNSDILEPETDHLTELEHESMHELIEVPVQQPSSSSMTALDSEYNFQEPKGAAPFPKLCEFCGKGPYKDPRHINNCKKAPEEAKKGRVRKCKKCPKVFRRTDSYKNHKC